MLLFNFLCVFCLMLQVHCHTISKSISKTEINDNTVIDNLFGLDFTTDSGQYDKRKTNNKWSLNNYKNDRGAPYINFDFDLKTSTNEATTKKVGLWRKFVRKFQKKPKKPAGRVKKTTKSYSIDYYSDETDNSKEKLRKYRNSKNNYDNRIKNIYRKRKRQTKYDDAKINKRFTSKDIDIKPYLDWLKNTSTSSNVSQTDYKNFSLMHVDDREPKPKYISTNKTTTKNVHAEDSGSIAIDSNAISNLSQLLSAMSNRMNQLKRIYNLKEQMAQTAYLRANVNATLPFKAAWPAATLPNPDEMLSDTAQIEAMLDEIKMNSLHSMAQDHPSVADLITNTVSETTFEVDPLLERTTIKNNIQSGGMTVMNAYVKLPDDSNLGNNSPLSELKGDKKHELSRRDCSNDKKKIFQNIKNNLSPEDKPTTCQKCRLYTCKCKDKKTTQFVADIQNVEKLSDDRTKITQPIFKKVDDYDMLSVYENMLSTNHRNNVNKLLTSSQTPLLYKWRYDPHFFKRSLGTLTDLKPKANIANLYNDDEYIHEYGENKATFKEKNTDKTNLLTTTESLIDSSFSDYVNGYKSYLNFQKELNQEKFSNLVRYKAHRHHTVEDIGKFINSKIPKIPDRSKRKFNDESDTMEDQDVSTKSDESWFKKHFYLFIDNGPPKKYHTAENMTVKLPSTLSKLNQVSQETKNKRKSDVHDMLQDYNVESVAKNYHILEVPDSKITPSDKLLTNFIKEYEPKIQMNTQQLHQFNKNTPKKILPNYKKISNGNTDAMENKIIIEQDPIYYNYNAMRIRKSLDHMQEGEKTTNSIDMLGQDLELNKLFDDLNIPKKRDDHTSKNFIKKIIDKFYPKAHESKQKKTKRNAHTNRNPRYNPLEKIRYFFKSTNSILDKSDENLLNAHITSFKPVKYGTTSDLDKIKEAIPDIKTDESPSSDATDISVDYDRQSTKDHNSFVTDEENTATGTTDSDTDPDTEDDESEPTEPMQDNRNLEGNLKFLTYSETTMLASGESDPSEKMSDNQFKTTMNKIRNEIDKVEMKIDQLDKKIPTASYSKPEQTLLNKVESLYLNDLDKIDGSYNDNFEDVKRSTLDTTRSTVRIDVILPPSLGKAVFQTITEPTKTSPTTLNLSKKSINVEKNNPALTQRITPSKDHTVETTTNSKLADKSTNHASTRTKQFVDYFNDLVIWNSDILSADSPTNPPWMKILTNDKKEPEFSTNSIKDLQDEVAELRYRLSDIKIYGNNINKVNTLSSTDTTVTKKDPLTTSKIVTHSKPTDKYKKQKEYILKDNIVVNSKAMKSSIIEDISNSHGKGIQKNYPMTPTTQTNQRPEQYFSTPIPMPMKDFEKFLKEHDIDVDSVTSPVNVNANNMNNKENTEDYYEQGLPSKHSAKKSDEIDLYRKTKKIKKHNKESDYDTAFSTTTVPDYTFPYTIDESFKNNYLVHKNKGNKKYKQNKKNTHVSDDLDITIIDFNNDDGDTESTTASYFQYPFHLKEKANKIVSTTKKICCKADKATVKMANKVEACKNKTVKKIKKIKDDAIKKIKSTSTKAAKFVKSTTAKTVKGIQKTVTAQVNKTKAKLQKLKCKFKSMTTKKPKPKVTCPPCPSFKKVEGENVTENLYSVNDKSLDDINDFYNKLTTRQTFVEQTTEFPEINEFTKMFEQTQDKPKKIMITNVMSRYDIIYDDHYRTVTKHNQLNKHLKNSRSIDISLAEIETREIINIVEVVQAVENFTRPSVVIHIELPTFYEPDRNARRVLPTTTKSIWSDYVMKYISGIALIELLTKFGVIKSIDSITDGSDKIFNANEVFSGNREQQNQDARHFYRRKRRGNNIDLQKVTEQDGAVSNASLVYDLKEIDDNGGRFERKLSFLPFFQSSEVNKTTSVTNMAAASTTASQSEAYTSDGNQDSSTTEDLFTTVIRVTMIPTTNKNLDTSQTSDEGYAINKRNSPNNKIKEKYTDTTTEQTTSSSSPTSETTSQANTKREHFGHRKHIQNIFTKKLRSTTPNATNTLTTTKYRVPAVKSLPASSTAPSSTTLAPVKTTTKSNFEETSTCNQLNNDDSTIKDTEYFESDKEVVNEVYFEPSIRLATEKTTKSLKKNKKKNKKKKKKHHLKGTTAVTTIKTTVDEDVDVDDDDNDEDSEVYIETSSRQEGESEIILDQTNEPQINEQETKVKKRAVHNDNTFTAKNVAALEVVVDLAKNINTNEVPVFISSPVLSTKTFDPNSANPNSDPNGLAATNSIEVHIAIPYPSHDKKRSAIDKIKVRRVFTAKLSTPVDLEYQIHSIEEPIDYRTTNAVELFQRTNSPIVESKSMSPGVYLLVGYPTKLPDDSIALQPVDFDMNKLKFERKSETSITPKITTTKNVGKVTLSKEFISALNEQLAIYNLFKNTSNSKRSRVKVNRRKKRFINWDSIKRYFGHNKVLKCRCEVNKPMCRACASCDAVMSELIFELDYLSKYMSDHCTEIQTFFYMNPSGGKRLRETVKNISSSLQDCYKKVQKKCDGRTCKLNTSPMEKRFFDEPLPRNIESLLTNLEGVANDLETARNFNYKFDDRLKKKGYTLINSIKHCLPSIIRDEHVVKPRQVNKSSYSLDNISVNIICNPETSTQPAAIDTSINYNFPEIQMDKNVIGYTFNLEDLDSDKKKSKSLRNLFSRNERRRKKEKIHRELITKVPLSKRHIKSQLKPPVLTDGGGSFWQDYLNNVQKPRTARHSLNNEFLKNPKVNISEKDVNEATITKKTTPKSEETFDFDLYSDNIHSFLKSLGELTFAEDVGTSLEADTTVQPTTRRNLTYISTEKTFNPPNKLITLSSKKTTLATKTSTLQTMVTTKVPPLLTITVKSRATVLQTKPLFTNSTTPRTTEESFLGKLKSATAKFIGKFKYTLSTEHKTPLKTEETTTKLLKTLNESSLTMIHKKTQNKPSTKKINNSQKDKQELLETVQKFKAKVNKNDTKKMRRKVKLRDSATQPTQEELSSKYLTKKPKTDITHLKINQNDFRLTTAQDRPQSKQTTIQASPRNVDSTELIISNLYSILNHQDKPSDKKKTSKADGLLMKILNNVGIRVVPEEKKKVDKESHLRDLREISVKEDILSNIKKNMKKRNFLHRKLTTKAAYTNTKVITKSTRSTQKTCKNSLKRNYEDDPQEAYEPQPGFICDLHATFEHIREQSRTLGPKDFENFVRNINCYKFKKIPDQFRVEPCDKSIYKSTSNSNISQLKYNLENLPKWDWIISKRSLKSIEHNDNEPADYYEYDDGGELNTEGDLDELVEPIREKKELRNLEQKVADDDIDEVFDETENRIKSREDFTDFAIRENGEKYDRFYKTKDGVYRRLKRKVRRSVDFSDVVDGLRDLPPLTPPKDEVYAMRGDSVILHCYSPELKIKSTLDFKGLLELIKYEWNTDRKEMLSYDNVVVEGPNIYIKMVKGINVGNYSCSRNKVFQRSVRLSVTALPQFNTVFVPVYECRTGCSYQDLRAMQCLSHVMADEACSCDRHCTVRIDDPTCLRDMDDESQQIRATVVLSTARGPRVRCGVQCRRDLQSSLALLTAANAPNLALVTVVLASEYGNRTFTPSSRHFRRSVVTRKLKKRDCNHHREYRRLASRMPPGGVDVVVACPAGYFLIREHKICVACPRNSVSAAGQNSCSRCPPGTRAAPGSTRCRLARTTRRYDCWLYPPIGLSYIGWGATAVATCVALALCGALRAALSRNTCVAPTGGVCAGGACVDRQLTAAKPSTTLTYSATQTEGRRMATSKVILTKFLNGTPPSSRVTDSQTKFEIWKEKNIPPPLPSIDFDSS